MILYVKNMVCDRCIMVVRQELQNLNYQVVQIELGQVEIKKDPNPEDLSLISSSFKLMGFELIDNVRERLVEQIKNQIVTLIHHTEEPGMNINFSSYLSLNLHKDYSYLSNLFSDVEEITIEKYIIQQKVERIKELLRYDELNLNEISNKLGYSSSAHLSGQFKKVTGITPSQFKSSLGASRKSIDRIK